MSWLSEGIETITGGKGIFPAIQDSFSDFGDWFTGKEAFELEKKFAEKMWAKNADLQKTFAKMGVQWRVNDAKKAGIHPLAALGAQTFSGSPISVGQPQAGGGVSPNVFMQQMLNFISQRNETNAKARYYDAMADSIIKGQPDSGQSPGHAVGGGSSDGSGDPGGSVTQTDYDLIEKPGGGLDVGMSRDAQGVDEDPGAAVRRFQDWRYIKAFSGKFMDMSNRHGPSWERYKKNVMSKHPKKAPDDGKMWQWSLQGTYWKQVPIGSPKFEDTSLIGSPKPIHGQVMEVLKQVINNASDKIEETDLKPKPNKPRAYPVESIGRGRGHYPEGQPGYKRRGMWEKRR